MVQLRISNEMKPERVQSIGAHQGQINRRLDLLGNNQPKVREQKVKNVHPMKSCVNQISTINFEPDTLPVHKPRKVYPVLSDVFTQDSNITNPTNTVQNNPNTNEPRNYLITSITRPNGNCVGLSSDHINATGGLNNSVAATHQSQLNPSNVITVPITKIIFVKGKTSSVVLKKPQNKLILPTVVRAGTLKRTIEGVDNSSSTVLKKYKYGDEAHSSSIVEPKPYELSRQEILNIFITSLVLAFKFDKTSFIINFISDHRNFHYHKEKLKKYSDKIIFDYIMKDYLIFLDDTEHYLFQVIRDKVERLLNNKNQILPTNSFQ